jgi:hypothetical protein
MRTLPSSRRDVMRALATLSVASVPTMGMASAGLMTATSSQAEDAIINSAWKQRQDAYAAYNALPAYDGPVAGGYALGERELWNVIDDAEEVIRSSTAATPRGAIIQLWCAMYHSITGRKDDDAVTRGDFAALDRIDSDLDWNARLMLAAIRSLQLMEG